MRIARTLALAVATAIAALALTATAASATESLEFGIEGGGGHCNFATKNCKIVAHSIQETRVDAHVFGFEFEQSRCEDEFNGYVGETGTGHIVNQVLTQHMGSTCGKRACTAPSELEWPFRIEETAPGVKTMFVEFCLEALDGSGARHCTIAVNVNYVNHDTIEFRATNRECAEGVAEVTGHWLAEGNDSTDVFISH